MGNRANGIGLFCPVCGRGKIVVAISTKEAKKLCLLKPENADQASWFLKCYVCKNQIGLTVHSV